MKKIIKLTESDIRRMVSEAVNELGYTTLLNAQNSANTTPNIGRYDNKYKHLTKYSDRDVADAIGTIEDALSEYSCRYGKFSRKVNGDNYHYPLTSQLSKAQRALEVIRDFFTRKQKQLDNIGSAYEDARSEAKKEFISVLKELYPQAINQEGTWRGDVNYDVLTDEMLQDVRQRVSPQTQEYIDQEEF